MELTPISSSHADTDTECLVVGVSENNSVVGSDKELDTLISELVDSGDFKPKAGSQIILRNPIGLRTKRLVLLGVGKADKFDALAQNEAFITLGRAQRLTNQPSDA